MQSREGSEIFERAIAEDLSVIGSLAEQLRGAVAQRRT